MSRKYCHLLGLMHLQVHLSDYDGKFGCYDGNLDNYDGNFGNYDGNFGGYDGNFGSFDGNFDGHILTNVTIFRAMRLWLWR